MTRRRPPTTPRPVRTLAPLLALLLALPAAAGARPTADERATGQSIPELFRTSEVCLACHNGLLTSTGEDVSIGTAWRASMMANSARDPYWQAAVRRETMDFPEARAAIENECSICHMPMARHEAHALGRSFEIFPQLEPVAAGAPLPRTAALAREGVSCTMCHQIEATGLGERESFVGGFAIDLEAPRGERSIYGPFEVTEGRRRIMRSASRFEPEKASHIQQSELCATCHTLYTHALGEGGGAELPEQMPYLEWRHSDYAEAGSGRTRSCQDCHMRPLEEPMAISSVLGEQREGFSRHAFRGANVLMPRVFARYRDELGIEATEAELEAAWRRTVEHVQSAGGRVEVESATVDGDTLRAEVTVENLAGHKLPSAYPSRRAWLHVRVSDAGGETVFESGALEPSGAIVGNDNDRDPRRYEPHHRTIDDPGQVQIWEGILFGPDDQVTTGLLTAVRYGKDNRLLPHGFDKATASPDIAVRGAAADDPDFVGGGDRVVYRVALGDAAGPYRIEVELWYQPIAWRWAHNLADYDAAEPQRFVRWYDELSTVSAVRMAGVSRLVD